MKLYGAMLKLPGFQESIGNTSDYDNRLIQFYEPYSLGGGQTDVSCLIFDYYPN